MTGLFGTTPADAWTLGQYDEHAGYDAMTGGIEIGEHVTLDAGDYGQRWNSDGFDMPRMMADAKAIAQVPAMLALVDAMRSGPFTPVAWVEAARDIARQLEGK